MRFAVTSAVIALAISGTTAFPVAAPSASHDGNEHTLAARGWTKASCKSVGGAWNAVKLMCTGSTGTLLYQNHFGGGSGGGGASSNSEKPIKAINSEVNTDNNQQQKGKSIKKTGRSEALVARGWTKASCKSVGGAWNAVKLMCTGSTGTLLYQNHFGGGSGGGGASSNSEKPIKAINSEVNTDNNQQQKGKDVKKHGRSETIVARAWSKASCKAAGGAWNAVKLMCTGSTGTILYQNHVGGKSGGGSSSNSEKPITAINSEVNTDNNQQQKAKGGIKKNGRSVVLSTREAEAVNQEAELY